MVIFRHNTEKVVYFLLLDRKYRNPSTDDDEDIKSKSESGDKNCGTNIWKRLDVISL